MQAHGGGGEEGLGRVDVRGKREEEEKEEEEEEEEEEIEIRNCFIA